MTQETKDEKIARLEKELAMSKAVELYYSAGVEGDGGKRSRKHIGVNSSKVIGALLSNSDAMSNFGINNTGEYLIHTDAESRKLFIQFCTSAIVTAVTSYKKTA